MYITSYWLLIEGCKSRVHDAIVEVHHVLKMLNTEKIHVLTMNMLKSCVACIQTSSIGH